MPLSDTAIRNAKPSDKARKMFDGGGLYLEVAPSGGKWWWLKYRFDGKEKRLSLEVYPDVSLKNGQETASRSLHGNGSPSTPADGLRIMPTEQSDDWSVISSRGSAVSLSPASPPLSY